VRRARIASTFPGAPWVVEAGGVDQEDVGDDRELLDGLGKDGTLAERQQAGQVGRLCLSGHDDLLVDVAGLSWGAGRTAQSVIGPAKWFTGPPEGAGHRSPRHGGSPCPFASLFPIAEGHETPGDDRGFRG
jgi:hypothetical protein